MTMYQSRPGRTGPTLLLKAFACVLCVLVAATGFALAGPAGAEGAKSQPVPTFAELLARLQGEPNPNGITIRKLRSPTSTSLAIVLDRDLTGDVLVELKNSNGDVDRARVAVEEGFILLSGNSPDFAIESSHRYCVRVWHQHWSAERCRRTSQSSAGQDFDPDIPPDMFSIQGATAPYQVELNPDYYYWAKTVYGNPSVLDQVVSFGDRGETLSDALLYLAPAIADLCWPDPDSGLTELDMVKDCVENILIDGIEYAGELLLGLDWFAEHYNERFAPFLECVTALAAWQLTDWQLSGSVVTNAGEWIAELLKSCFQVMADDVFFGDESENQEAYGFYESSEWGKDLVMAALIGSLTNGFAGGLSALFGALLIEDFPDEVPPLEQFWWYWVLDADVTENAFEFEDRALLESVKDTLWCLSSPFCDPGRRQTKRVKAVDTREIVQASFPIGQHATAAAMDRDLGMGSYSSATNEWWATLSYEQAATFLDDDTDLPVSAAVLSWAIGEIGMADPSCGFFEMNWNHKFAVHCGNEVGDGSEPAVILPVLTAGVGSGDSLTGELNVAVTTATKFEVILKNASGSPICLGEFYAGGGVQKAIPLENLTSGCSDAASIWLLAKDGVRGAAVSLNLDRSHDSTAVAQRTTLALDASPARTTPSMYFPGFWNYEIGSWTGSTAISLVNASTTSRTFYIAGRDEEGNTAVSEVDVPSGGRHWIRPADINIDSDAAHGSVQVFCNPPGCAMAAAAVTEIRQHDEMRRWSAYGGQTAERSSNTAHMPNYYYLNADGGPAELFSAGVAMPIDRAATTFIDLIDRPGCGLCDDFVPAFESQSTLAFVPARFNVRHVANGAEGFRSWSANFENVHSRIVGVGKEIGQGTEAQYRMLSEADGGNWFVAPNLERVNHCCTAAMGPRVSSAVVAQNVGRVTANVQVRLFHWNGQPAGSWSRQVAPGASFGVNIGGNRGSAECGDLGITQCNQLLDEIGNDWNGYAIVSSDDGTISGIVKRSVETPDPNQYYFYTGKRVRSAFNVTTWSGEPPVDVRSSRVPDTQRLSIGRVSVATGTSKN